MIILERRGFRIGLDLGYELESAIVQECCPFFAQTSSKRNDAPRKLFWIVRYSPEDDQSQWEMIEEEIVGEGKRVIARNNTTRRFAILCPNTKESIVKNSVRIIRALFRSHVSSSGAKFFHGSCVSIRGSGLLLVGNKRAGKTTMLLHLLGLHEVSFVCNDDPILATTGRTTSVLGSPRSISIRTDVMALPSVCRVIQKIPHNLIVDQEEGYSIIRPGVLCQTIGCNMIESAPLKIVCFPTFDSKSRPVLTEISQEIGLERLSHYREVDREKYTGYLDGIELNSQEVISDSRLLIDVRFVELRFPFEWAADAARLVAEVAE